MQTYFYQVADYLQGQIRGEERFKREIEAESTDFVRFNRGLVRQPGHVRQMQLAIDWIDGERHAGSSISLCWNWEEDRKELDAIIAALREQLPDLPADPHFMMATEVNSSCHSIESTLPPCSLMVEQILDAVQGYDFVGILASGPMYRGFANSYGQRNWHEIASFNLDFSLYYNTDKAVKAGYAGLEWSEAGFRTKFAEAVEQFNLLSLPPVSVPPGAYRAYFTPTALYEVLTMLNWDSFSDKGMRTKQSALRRMRDEGLTLHPSFSLMENTKDGIAPGFQEDGFIKPDQVSIIERGALVGSMVSPRTAREYGAVSNGASGRESMASMEVAAGQLPLADVLKELGTGVYVSNLWYLNFSDRAHCRMTGMTRFATFWVEDGKIKAPLNVMRFDDSMFKLLGDSLLGLTVERDMIIDSESYESRVVNSARLPGALVKDLMFVL